MVDVARNLNVKLSAIDCCSCGFTIWMQQDFEARRRADGKSFHCTSCGQSQGWHGKSIADELKAAQKELQNQRKLREWAEQEARNVKQERDKAVADRDHKERQRRSEKGYNTRLRNRVGHGVCPCCNRSFVNLQRHMAGQHPGFIPKANLP